MKYKKLYFARFTDKMTNQMFYKFGYTGNGDAYDRFKSEGRYWHIKIMTSATGPEIEVYDQEARFKREFPKNVYVKRKFKGITEIAQLNRDQVGYVFEEFKKLQQKWGALEYRHKMMFINPS
jgi:hypothetical protein